MGLTLPLQVLNTRRNLTDPPLMSFHDLVAGQTTTTFNLSAGLYEMVYNAVDPNNPGVCQVLDANSNVLASVNTTIGMIQDATGHAWWVVGYLGLTGCSINVTQAARNVVIYGKKTV